MAAASSRMFAEVDTERSLPAPLSKSQSLDVELPSLQPDQ